MISRISVHTSGPLRMFEFRRGTIVVGSGARSDIVLDSCKRIRLFTLHIMDSGFRIIPEDFDDDIRVKTINEGRLKQLEEALVVPKGTEIFLNRELILRLEDLILEAKSNEITFTSVGSLKNALENGPKTPILHLETLLRFALQTAHCRPNELAFHIKKVCEEKKDLDFLQIIFPIGEVEPWDRQKKYGSSAVQISIGSNIKGKCGGLQQLKGGNTIICHQNKQDTWLIPVRIDERLLAILHLQVFNENSSLKETFKVLAPWLNQLLILLSSFVERRYLQQENRTLKSENRHFRERQRRHYLYKKLATSSLAMKMVHQKLERLVLSQEAVLLTGEAGTGKELLARALHHHSRRAKSMMISQNCGAKDQKKLDVEIFGEKNKRGIVELAEGGTIFFDEIHSLSEPLQLKLLRMLVDGEIFRNGEAISRPINVRIIASTHRDLAQLSQALLFRRDLAMLLSRRPIHLPPLRKRKEDIAPLVKTFIKSYARRYRRMVNSIDAETLHWLTTLRWPGNVRELQSMIERAVLDMDPKVKVLTRAHFELH